MGKTIANQLLCALIAGEGPRGVAVDHAWQLVEQQYQGQPALGQFGPVLQLSVQRLFDQCTEAFAGLGILLWTVTEPEALLFSRDLACAGALAEPPVEQVLPGRLHRSALVIAGDALDFFLRAEEHRHALVQESGWISRMRWEPVVAAPPACSMIIDIGLASYIRRNLPALSGSRASRGYMKMPPRVRIRCTSATIEAIQRML